MPFEPGHQLSPGRPKGSVNKRTVEFQQVLEKHNFNVAEALIWCYSEAKDRYQDYNERFMDGRISPMEDQAPKYLKIASDMAKDMASYSFPKLKAIETKKSSLMEELAPEHRLEILKQYVQKLESDLKSGSGTA